MGDRTLQVAQRDEQGERYDGDPVGASVGLGAGVEHDGVDAVVAELVAEPGAW